MALASSLGTGSLLQLGISLGDIAVIFQHGRQVGNWLFVSKNDDDFFESINETPTALLRRRDLINSVQMKARWSDIELLYQGERISAADRGVKNNQDLSDFSWLMVALSAAAGWCIADATFRQILTEVFVQVLNGGDKSESQEQSIRAQLATNLSSWKSLASAKTLDKQVLTVMKKYYKEQLKTADKQDAAIPQLNRPETAELKRFLHWLIGEPDSYEFITLSMMVFMVAGALQGVGVHVRTKGSRTYEAEPVVRYIEPNEHKPLNSKWFYNSESHETRRKVQLRAPQIAYPFQSPQAMIETIALPRHVRNEMEVLWKLGADAGAKVVLTPSAELPFSPTSDIDYAVDSFDVPTSKFDTTLSLLAHHAFPVISESILIGLEYLTKELSPTRIEWLHRYTAVEYLVRQTTAPSHRSENIEVFQKYTALVSGFYYQMLAPWVSLEYIDQGAYFRGIWGDASPLFLAMCSQFGDELARKHTVSRSHLLHLLSAMYAGRQKLYTPTAPTTGLLGILGPVSVLSMSLIRVSDRPQTIACFALISLPIIDLLPDSHGELYAGLDCGIDFFSDHEERAAPVRPHEPRKPWAVDAKMGMLFGEDTGVLMAARCEGRLVGWFSPLAADVAFLSPAFVVSKESPNQDQRDLNGFEVAEEQWINSRVRIPSVEDTTDEDQVVLVQSYGCPALRYAAAGFYMSANQEVAVSSGNIRTAFERVEAQGPAVIIA